jgi:hypothetical protein
MKLLHAISRSKWKGFAWQTSEAQGSICQAISCVLIDPAQKLA